MTAGYKEKELKDALERNIVKFLLELGTGFAFIGREYRIMIGKTEKFIDMLFYNLKLRCYVVVEIKTDKFDSDNIGQLGTYVAVVNHILRTETDNPTIGILICKTKDNVLAQYALESSSQPIGISEYELSKLYPADFKGTLPTIEELEQEAGK
jgi:RecB family endonuclease NucS